MTNQHQPTDLKQVSALSETFGNVLRARDSAEIKAWDSLSRYKFEMFGYWASGWVKYNQLLPKEHKRGNPFRSLVHVARAHIKTEGDE
ncbi:MAG: hypothetical protein V3S33_02245 [Gammaproteobacteria bacterium]